MIAAWMLYCLMVALLLAFAAATVESALRLRGRPARWVWAVALAGSLLLPVVAWLGPDLVPTPASTAAEPGAGAVAVMASEAGGDPLARVEAAPTWLDRAGAALPRLDVPLMWLWLGSSAGLVLLFGAAQWRLARRRKRWESTHVDGVPVLVSRGVGPAVVGFVRSAIVLPEWALASERRLRDLMLAHEEEHLRAGDPRLLLGAFVLLAAMPWNPVLWWQLRRLRLALEMDCDARVLRRHPDLRAYGTLLLELGQRGAGGQWAVAAAFSEPVTTLERRIRMMTSRKPRRAALRAAVSTGVGGLLVLAACETPTPTQLAPVDGSVVYTAENVPAPEKVAVRDHRAAVERYFPQVLTEGMGDNAALAFVVNEQGEIVEAKALRKRTLEPLRASRVEVRPGANANVMAFTVPRFEHADFQSLEIEPGKIRQVEVSRTPAGVLGPDPVSVVWIREGGEGEAALAITSPRPGEGVIRLRSGKDQPDVIMVAPTETLVMTPDGAPLESPLIVIDGEVKPEGFSLRGAGITPERIERIEVLKGEAAVRLYGSRAERGALSITTRKTAEAKPNSQ
jgi:beta-lactamase regulating signal transducer with metallopeptidase domain